MKNRKLSKIILFSFVSLIFLPTTYADASWPVEREMITNLRICEAIMAHVGSGKHGQAYLLSKPKDLALSKDLTPSKTKTIVSEAALWIKQIQKLVSSRKFNSDDVEAIMSDLNSLEPYDVFALVEANLRRIRSGEQLEIGLRVVRNMRKKIYNFEEIGAPRGVFFKPQDYQPGIAIEHPNPLGSAAADPDATGGYGPAVRALEDREN
ncbi:MAG: hypothetical protein J0L93_08530 [Deltaproteobacteria bacterium]|nr:hypothetical protein [Deltaproteobacteria bacterium]